MHSLLCSNYAKAIARQRPYNPAAEVWSGQWLHNAAIDEPLEMVYVVKPIQTLYNEE
jgi:hypothetical protein